MGAWRRKLFSLINDINDIHATLKVAAEWSKTSINLLDATVSIEENLIETDLYVKPTDSHQYTNTCYHLPAILVTVKKEYPTTRQKIYLRKDVMI